MYFTFLGTGAGVPAKLRNTASMVLTMPEYQGDAWMFDCGEATQHQILHTSVKLSKIKKIFITHLHGDHIYGLPGVLGSRSFQGGDDQLTVFGPKGIKDFIEMSLSISSTYLKYPLEIIEIDEDGVIYEDKYFKVSAKELEHGITCYGYRIEEKDQPGTLLVDRLKAEGIMPGPIYREFKEKAAVTLPNGRTLNSSDYIGPDKKGRKIAVLGDTRICQAAVDLAEGVDVLIHESTFSHGMEEKAYDYFHSTSSQAAQTAKAANAAALILTHISSRFQEDDHLLLEEAREIFSPVYLAKDFWTYKID
ncbi:ribonuclease Z [Scopulibacillus daqui]|uniref:Ribonuclease Z n=1 Tax=Scopulibacillus daqui TaxID=1469162 RepID=A0ABS2Q1H9_9BACL|nr:ribonuclease Z [Scopulibacillus daqui]MBM7646145.1 ribonuclease Z [Scopulibacillus daqui]